MWTVEVTFKLNSRVIRHNCVYWSDNNPHAILEEKLYLPGVTVWAGIWSEGFVGPYFFDGTIIFKKYFDMLRDIVIPQLQNNPIYENISFTGSKMEHYLEVRYFLNNTFGE